MSKIMILAALLAGCAPPSVVPAWVERAEPACDIVNGVITSLQGLSFVSSDGDRYVYRGVYCGEIIAPSRAGSSCEQTFTLVPCELDPDAGYCSAAPR
jgi:hypothetical protein